ncbi:esterase [Novosphingobium sp. FSW06-99]|nr:esterase [Novosphingobium sp. FSW06-99]
MAVEHPRSSSRANSIVLRLDNPMQTNAPQVVYLHGRGSSEREVTRIVQAFSGASVRAYRAPLREGAGYAWFENQGIGIARTDSLAAELPKVSDWIKTDNGAQRPWLCGFSNGAAMAASLALAEPDAYAGLVMIGGCFATDQLPTARLRAMPVLFCRGDHDTVIPPTKFRQALTYLSDHSRAALDAITYPGGHDVTIDVVTAVSRWFRARAV